MDFTFEDAFIVLVVEEPQVLAPIRHYAPFYADVVDDGIAIYAFIAGSDAPPDDYAYAVVPYALGYAERVVCSCAHAAHPVL